MITLHLLASRIVRHMGQVKVNFPIGTDTTCHNFFGVSVKCVNACECEVCVSARECVWAHVSECE